VPDHLRAVRHFHASASIRPGRSGACIHMSKSVCSRTVATAEGRLTEERTGQWRGAVREVVPLDFDYAIIMAVMNFCPACGSPVGPGTLFCDSCGFRLNSPSVPAQLNLVAPVGDPVAPPIAAKAGAGKQLANFLGIVAALIVLGTAAAIILPNLQLSKPNTSNQAPLVDPVTLINWHLEACQSSQRGYIVAEWDCQGTIALRVSQPVFTSNVLTVGLDYPSSGSFFHGGAPLPANFMGTVTVPITNDREPACAAGTYARTISVYDGQSYASPTLIANIPITITQTCG
jgi:hypothetical protein